MDEILAPDFLKFAIPIAGAAIAWFGNESRKRSAEEYARKEERYRALIRAFRGFYTATPSQDQREAFLQELNQCWLYCPDSVIRAGYEFLESVHTAANATQQRKQELAGAFFLEIRRDLLRRRRVRGTRFSESDFRHFKANP